MKFNLVVLFLFLITEFSYGIDNTFDLSGWHNDGMVIEEVYSIDILKNKSSHDNTYPEVKDPPYFIIPDPFKGGKQFLCFPYDTTENQYGYGANNRVDWAYNIEYPDPDTVEVKDSLVVKFDFNVDLGPGDTLIVVAVLWDSVGPENKPKYFSIGRAIIGSTQDDPDHPSGWWHSDEISEVSFVFIPTREMKENYTCGFMHLRFRFVSDAAMNGRDGYGFGAGIDNVVIKGYNSGVIKRLVDDNFELDPYQGPPYRPGYGWVIQGSSIEKWGVLKKYNYKKFTDIDNTNWGILKRFPF